MYLNPGKTKNKVLKTIMIYFIKLNSVNIEPEIIGINQKQFFKFKLFNVPIWVHNRRLLNYFPHISPLVRYLIFIHFLSRRIH